jgi:hypothetical protein
MDTVSCILNPDGPAVDRAIVFPFINTDIDGVTRPTGKSSDIGARELGEIKEIPYSRQGGLPKNGFSGNWRAAVRLS